MDVGEVLEPEELLQVAHVCLNADLGCESRSAVTLSGEGRAMDDVPALSQTAPDLAPAPASVHGTVHQDECGHLDTPPPGRARRQRFCRERGAGAGSDEGC